jgi:hypothetical protein
MILSFQAEKAGAATTFCIDGRETAEKNPTRYINAARSKEPLGSFFRVVQQKHILAYNMIENDIARHDNIFKYIGLIHPRIDFMSQWKLTSLCHFDNIFPGSKAV